jgi:hypothetical protein
MERSHASRTLEPMRCESIDFLPVAAPGRDGGE